MDREDRHPAQKLARTSRELGPFLSWGWQFALTLGALAWFGRWLDGKYETGVLFILLGIFMGLFGGFYNLYRIIAKASTRKSTKGGR